jgi:hypothetical protein
VSKREGYLCFFFPAYRSSPVVAYLRGSFGSDEGVALRTCQVGRRSLVHWAEGDQAVDFVGLPTFWVLQSQFFPSKPFQIVCDRKIASSIQYSLRTHRLLSWGFHASRMTGHLTMIIYRFFDCTTLVVERTGTIIYIFYKLCKE